MSGFLYMRVAIPASAVAKLSPQGRGAYLRASKRLSDSMRGITGCEAQPVFDRYTAAFSCSGECTDSQASNLVCGVDAVAMAALCTVHLCMEHDGVDMSRWVGLSAADAESSDAVDDMVAGFVALPRTWREAALKRLRSHAPKLFKRVYLDAP